MGEYRVAIAAIRVQVPVGAPWALGLLGVVVSLARRISARFESEKVHHILARRSTGQDTALRRQQSRFESGRASHLLIYY